MKLNSNLSKLNALKVSADGKLSGGFASLNSTQMRKINGGKKQADGNVNCVNTQDCSGGGGNEQCTNTVSC